MRVCWLERASRADRRAAVARSAIRCTFCAAASASADSSDSHCCVAAKCAEWTNPANPDSVLARARATAAANALRACGSVSAAELGTPCARDAATLADVIGCTLDAYEAGVAALIAETYADACTLADVPCRFVRRETDLDPRVVLGAAAE